MVEALKDERRLRWLAFGAGAIGTYIGGSLALRGHRVVFLERPEVADVLRHRGLRLNIMGQEMTAPSPPLAQSIGEALAQGPYDAAIFALKSFDTQAALKGIGPRVQDMPPVLCLQNGVENEERIAAALGVDKVIAGTVTSAIGRRAAGDIILERLRGVGLATGHPLSPVLARALDEAGLNAHLYPRAEDMKWSKMLTNLLANATSAILGLTPAEIFSHSGLYRLEISQLREALTVMRAQGIQVVDLPATPVRLLAFAVRYLPPSLSRPLLMRAVGRGRGGKMPSFYLDLQSGRGQSEVDYLNGAVVRYGAQAGIPTPVNHLLNEILLGLTRGDIAPEEFALRPDRLLDLLIGRS
jgi:2-dehydropantoate 2-reductase